EVRERKREIPNSRQRRLLRDSPANPSRGRGWNRWKGVYEIVPLSAQQHLGCLYLFDCPRGLPTFPRLSSDAQTRNNEGTSAAGKLYSATYIFSDHVPGHTPCPEF